MFIFIYFRSDFTFGVETYTADVVSHVVSSSAVLLSSLFITFPFYLKLFDPIPSFFLHSPLSLIRLSSTLPLNVLSSNHNYKTKTENAFTLFQYKDLNAWQSPALSVY